MSQSRLRAKAQEYADEREIVLQSHLGFGQDGSVWSTDVRTAVKCFERFGGYDRELRCYQRLRDRNVTRIGKCDIPTLVNHDESLLVVEMDIVRPPYILDFGKAWIDEKPPYSHEQLAEAMEGQRARWSEDDWPDVVMIVAQLEKLGIYYLDTKPGNIALR